MSYKIVLIQLTLVISVAGYAHYRDRIPNGHRMSHPCKPNYKWYGVGHTNPLGGGERNSFGEDFELFGEEWNECLCMADSDGDGMTNGQELGDPECKWKPDEKPERTTDITHPGVCQPIGDSRCALHNDPFLDCSVSKDFQCEDLNHPSVKNVTYRLDQTNVPSDDTTYICQAFDFPTDGDYHLIAALPEVDNVNIIHHIIIYGCPNDLDAGALDDYATPTKCNMEECQDSLMVWSVGINGICLDDQLGFRIGSNGYKSFILELHWNNPEMKSTYTDSSGMTLFYTDQRRPYNAGVLSIGPLFLQIPPGYLDVKGYGGCSGECTRQTLGDKKIYINSILPHMHYLGSSMSLEQKRNGVTIRKIDFPQYFYDSPEVSDLDEPIEVRGGDELLTTCYYSSKSTDSFTYYGQETNDEMCFAIVTYYPKENLDITVCMEVDGYGLCGLNFNQNYTECNITAFYEKLYLFLANVGDKCDSTGVVCKPECPLAIADLNTDECLTTNSANTVKAGLLWYMNQELGDKEGEKYLNMLASCDLKPEDEDSHELSNEDSHEDLSESCKRITSSGPSIVSSTYFAVIFSMGIMMLFVK